MYGMFFPCDYDGGRLPEKKTDPNSGTACLIELARGLGALLKGGWKPMRTIILCSWSGEELGMLGSTAWGEENAKVCVCARACVCFFVATCCSRQRTSIRGAP